MSTFKFLRAYLAFHGLQHVKYKLCY